MDEQTRYDRQVRLWGKATQQQLQLTEIHINKITSVSAEVVKNLVLAGVHSVIVNDEAIINDNELKTNFLIQGCNIKEKRGDASVRKLQSLNPYVNVRLANKLSDSDIITVKNSFKVIITLINGFSEAFIEVRNPENKLADLILLVADLGNLTLGFILSKRQGISYEEQLELLINKNNNIKPIIFQKSLLLMKMLEYPEEASFFEKLNFVKEIVNDLNLSQISRKDVEFIAGICSKNLLGSAIESTVAGGIFAQLIIKEVGIGKENLEEEGYAWSICDSTNGTEVQVGHLFNP